VAALARARNEPTGTGRDETATTPAVFRRRLQTTFLGVFRTQLPVGGWMEEPTKLKVLLALEPRVVMAAMHTTTISASITAYSTAVGPSSCFRNDTSFLVKPRIGNSRRL